jgi:hypothetical protein
MSLTQSSRHSDEINSTRSQSFPTADDIPLSTASRQAMNSFIDARGGASEARASCPRGAALAKILRGARARTHGKEVAFP